MPSSGNRAMATNDTAKVTASTANTNRATSTPPPPPASAVTSAKNPAPTGIMPYEVPRTSPFAVARSSSPSTRSGMDASRAGRNTMPASSTTNAHR